MLRTSNDTDTTGAWQDALLQISQKLLFQRDVSAILCAMLPLPIPCQFIDLSLTLPRQHLCCDRDGLRTTPALVLGEVPPEGHSRCVLPITSPRRQFGEVGFTRTDGYHYSRDERDFLCRLAQMLALALENLSVHETLREENDVLRHERDHHRILVDVTNSVISCLDIDALAAEVSKEIHRFFGIDYISLALCEGSGENAHLKVYLTHYMPGKPMRREQKRVAMADNIVASRVLSDSHPVLIDLCTPSQSVRDDPHLMEMRNAGLSSLCLLPLAYGHKPLGMIKLARHNADTDTFSETNVRLLSQICARIAIAVDNARSYDEITRLKDNLEHENIWLNEQMHNSGSFGEIIWQSAAMSALLEQVQMVADSDSTVLILGETGTGKELIARAIHKHSARSRQRMVKMNCAAVPSGLLESDLFGHEKGAFTGATTTRQGRFELAEGGTLFLDEVGDMPLELQPKLLRVLQEREIERLGGSKVIAVNARLIAATNRDLKDMVANREYRSDLYYRLNVFPITIPPLRERPEDIPLLAKFFTQKISRRMNRTIDSIPGETLRRLSQLPWPGNVRELENVIERAVILTRGATLNLQLDELQHTAMVPLAPPPIVEPKRKPREALENDEVERQRIIQALREANGIVAGPRGAAIRLGVKRTTLLSRMQRLGISPQEW
ncbi:sigma 54-interacting transcriptional regulator [Acerihabitans sp. TG2]|uniref:sigma 54-interacting transcriptional regulator n=1 Tax=Acerihabitans sp. TG2 TaxID=3096008 RepID=UPI002B226FF4|nr:sigma 54-interacting transcriptional regulator [Acerihabitans sp. TG2]MEA9391368.1 sigma 54-interacting transcriptional regulator [Acerihabitans sp. TG2]